MLQLLEPKGGNLIENFSFVRNQRGQNEIKGRDPVGGHDKKMVPQIVDIPHFAPAVQRKVDVSDGHSHSMVAGGLDEISSTTRLIPRTSLIMRLEILERTGRGRSAQS